VACLLLDGIDDDAIGAPLHRLPQARGIAAEDQRDLQHPV